MHMYMKVHIYICMYILLCYIIKHICIMCAYVL